MNLFISHALADREFAAELQRGMEKLGATVYDPVTEMKAGESLSTAIRQALEDSDGFVFVVPAPGTSGANFAFFEAGAARAMGKRIVAVMPKSEKSRMNELPSDLYGLGVFDASRKAPGDVAASLMNALKAA